IRHFYPNGDPKGHPHAYDAATNPILLKPVHRNPMLPHALGEHSLEGADLLSSLPNLSPSEAIALIRAARLYQDALWVVESEPELSWVLLVSAIEVAAGQWRSAQDNPLERLRASRPQLEELLKPYGEELIEKVAQQIADY